MPTINFYVMRHPEHVDNVLTDVGISQVMQSTNKNLKGLHFSLCIHSELARSKNTVALVLKTLQHPSVKIEQREVGFAWALSDSELPPYVDPIKRPDFVAAQQDIIALRGDNPRNHLVSDWFERCPKTLALRGSMTITLLSVARELNKDCNVLIGSHSPTGELATLRPRQTRCLGFADIIKYVVRLDNNLMPKISESVVL